MRNLVTFHFYFGHQFITIKSDLRLRKMAAEHEMVVPFLPNTDIARATYYSVIDAPLGTDE